MALVLNHQIVKRFCHLVVISKIYSHLVTKDPQHLNPALSAVATNRTNSDVSGMSQSLIPQTMTFKETNVSLCVSTYGALDTGCRHCNVHHSLMYHFMSHFLIKYRHPSMPTPPPAAAKQQQQQNCCHTSVF